MDKVLSMILSKGGLRWGGGGLLVASGGLLLSGYVTPDASQEAQVGGAILAVAGVLLGLVAGKISPKAPSA